VRSPAAALRRPLPSVARLRAALAPSPRLKRRAIVVVALSLLLTGLYLLWLRDSSLVAVENVTVTGLTSEDSERARAALISTAETMTTLHLDRVKLEQTAAAFPVVARIELTPDFPNGLEIHVVEHRPVAILDVGGRGVPVAGDGSILVSLPVKGDLPRIELSGGLPQRELPPGAARDSALVAGAAPAVIGRRLESIGREGGARGVVVQVKDGPELVFGSPERARAKWDAAIRVLADDEAAGAAYIDVRIPERPVAGGLAVTTVAPVAPIDETATLATPAPVDPTATTPVDPSLVAPTPAPGTVAPTTPTPVAPAPADPTGGVVP
jgi:cell division protein FtsQ